MSIKEINRVVLFAYAPIFLPEDTSGINNTWIYHRAPDGYLFRLIKLQVSNVTENNNQYGICAIYDGHEYTHWNQWPGVESRELLGRVELHNYSLFGELDLHAWMCKEYTIGVRSTSINYPTKLCVIIWYYLEKASREELLEYAIKHPKDEDAFKRALRGSTVEPEEA